MKKIWKKNQIMITALAIMIAVAGYLNFAGDKLSDEDFLSLGNEAIDGDISDEDVYAVNVTDVDDELAQGLTDETGDIASLDEESAKLTGDYLDESMKVTGDGLASAEETMGENTENPADETPGEAVFTSGTGISSLAGAKLIKEQTRAKNKETLLEIINNENVTDEKKQDAINSMIAMTSLAEKESAAEVLLEAKGYEGVVVSITDQTADVIVGSANLTDAQTAQIMDIVQRKTEITPENIVITMSANK